MEPPNQEELQNMLRARIRQVLGGLTYREREIIIMRYGLHDGYSYTLEEIGQVFGLCRERIRQIEAKAVRKLQQPGGNHTVKTKPKRKLKRRKSKNETT